MFGAVSPFISRPIGSDLTSVIETTYFGLLVQINRESQLQPHHYLQMAALTPKASALLRSCARQQLPILRASSVATQRRGKASPAVEQASGEVDRTPTFQSPFRDLDAKPTTMIPDFSKYKSSRGGTTNKTFQYFMVGTMGLLTAAGAKATVEGV